MIKVVLSFSGCFSSELIQLVLPWGVSVSRSTELAGTTGQSEAERQADNFKVLEILAFSREVDMGWEKTC